MKDQKLFPFLKNKYFPGKRLMTRDMEAEQKYVSDKRRLSNLIFHGSGIMCGMQVYSFVGEKPVDDKKIGGMPIVVEPGMAIDSKGRDIVIPERIYIHLEDIEGFLETKDANIVYLCIAYEETLCEPVHGVFDDDFVQEKFNRIKEGYKLYVTATKPCVENETVRNGIEGSLENVMNKGREICLAEIEIAQFAADCKIEKIISLNSEAHNLLSPIEKSSKKGKESDYYADDIKGSSSCGIIEIKIPRNANVGAVLLSRETSHNLGCGPVIISASVVIDGGRIFGDAEIFKEARGVKYAIKTDEEKGTFYIAVRLGAGQKKEKIRFSWLATHYPRNAINDTQMPSIVITPSVVSVERGERVKFECQVFALDPYPVIWELVQKNFGFIDQVGNYKAPNIPGVYEIVAYCGVGPNEVRASSFVVVRE